MTKLLALLLMVPLWMLPGCRPSQPQPGAAFDVPALIGKSILEVEAAVGPPTETHEKSLAATSQGLHDGFKRWDREVASLVVHYDLATGRVKHLLLDAGAKLTGGSFGSEEEALAAGNLRQGDGGYAVDLIPLKDAGRIWMVRVTPRN